MRCSAAPVFLLCMARLLCFGGLVVCLPPRQRSGSLRFRGAGGESVGVDVEARDAAGQHKLGSGSCNLLDRR
jgi:hypothetical protein